jgi:hypothetical protein
LKTYLWKKVSIKANFKPTYISKPSQQSYWVHWIYNKRWNYYWHISWIWKLY